MSICEISYEKDCKTHVKKHFIYLVKEVDKAQKNISPPRIDITKKMDTKNKTERFHFRVKGTFYIAQDGDMFKVNFCHSLDIMIIWNKKKLSPKKSATLT